MGSRGRELLNPGEEANVPYHGGPIDRALIQSAPRTLLCDGCVLPPGGFPRPELFTDVAERAAEHLNRPLRDAAVREEVDRWYLPLSRNYVVPRRGLREEWLAQHGAQFHPRRMMYLADARTRILAHLWEKPTAVAASWSAAALLGVVDFSHDADAWVVGGGDTRPPTSPLHPGRIRCRYDFKAWTLYEGDRKLGLTPPMLTLVQCLQSTLRGEHRWEVPAIPGYEASLLRGVQVIDRFRRVCGISAADVRTACHSFLNWRTIRRLARLSGPGSDSPPETSLRLLFEPITREFAGNLLPQLPILRDGSMGESCQDLPPSRCLTIIDLADPVHRLAFFYDGDNHLERRHRDRDARITAELIAMGWLPFRVSAGMLRDPVGLRSRVRNLYLQRMK